MDKVGLNSLKQEARRGERQIDDEAGRSTSARKSIRKKGRECT